MRVLGFSFIAALAFSSFLQAQGGPVAFRLRDDSLRNARPLQPLNEGSKRGTYAIEGLLIGTGVGITVGVVFGLTRGEDTDLSPEESAFYGGLAFGLIGAAAGLIVGALTEKPWPSTESQLRIEANRTGIGFVFRARFQDVLPNVPKH